MALRLCVAAALGLVLLTCENASPSRSVKIPVHVQNVVLDAGLSPVVVLEENDGSRVLRIWIGLAEAHSIAARLAKREVVRPNTHDLVTVAEAAQRGGAEAVTLVNTVLGMAIDVATRRPILGAGGGGLSGTAFRTVAVRAIHDVSAALPQLPIVGVGGVSHGVDAIELAMAGAGAVQVGTATFAEPRAAARILSELARWCEEQQVETWRELVGAVHEGTTHD